MADKKRGWIGVDFDGTLATYQRGQFPALGEPIKAMRDRIRKWINDGWEVRIVTARVASTADDGGEGNQYEAPEIQRRKIEQWCVNHLGYQLKVTAEKDGGMVELWDDRAIRVERNTGRVAKTLPRRGSKKR